MPRGAQSHRRHAFQLDALSSLILVKVNVVAVLKKELDKPSWTREQVAVGTATDHKAAFAGMNTTYLDGGTRSHFIGFLRETHPRMVARYERLYARKYVAKNYANLVRRRFDALRKQHRLPARTRDDD